MAEHVSDAAEGIRSETPPVRVTRNKIAIALGVSTLAKTGQADEHWPRTSMAITGFVETNDQFFRRRLDHQIDVIVRGGFTPTVNDVANAMNANGRRGEIEAAIAGHSIKRS